MTVDDKPLHMTPFPPDARYNDADLLYWDKDTEAAKFRIKVEGRQQSLVERKREYELIGFEPWQAWLRAVNDHEPLPPDQWPSARQAEKRKDGEIQPEEFWTDISGVWREARDLHDMDTVMKLTPIFARKLERKAVKGDEKTPEELAQEALKEAERLGG